MMSSYERGTKAADFAADVVKQLLTLSTGILALTITFAKEIVADPAKTPAFLLGFAWIGYIVSILCGLWALLALTGELEPKPAADAEPQPAKDPSIRGRNVTLPAILQIGSFLIATTVIAAYGIFALGALGAAAADGSPLPSASASAP